jgi:aryl-alcohol dehydrogenase-like predicted oxidoreductase
MTNDNLYNLDAY